MRRLGTSKYGTAAVILVGLVVSIAALGGCNDTDDASPGKEGGGTSSGGGTSGGGSTSGGAAGADSKGGGGAGGALTCDCGSDVANATIPLDCARALGWRPTLERDLSLYQHPNQFGWPFYVLLGTCAAGYHTLSFQEALEQGGERTYDANGDAVYDRFGGYDGAVPDACGFDEDFSLGTITIGTDPAQDCSYCLLAGHDDGVGGAGGDGGSGGADAREPNYLESKTRPCAASDLE